MKKLLLINNKNADSVCTVSKTKEHPYRMFKLTNNSFLTSVIEEKSEIAPHLIDRHDWPNIYYYNCVIDVTKPETIFHKNSTTGDKILPFVIEQEKVNDIDALEDLKFAESLLSNKS